MITKSYEFDRKFKNDIKSIQLTRNPFRIKGSYSVKEYGEFITDIDIETFVYYDTKLLTLISNMLRRIRDNKSFTFLHVSCGVKKDFIVPWSIDGSGSCYFDLDTARSWFQNFALKKLIPSTDIIEIKKLLFKDTISIHDLCQIEKILDPYSEVRWTRNDIQIGYKVVNDVKYNLIPIIKKEGIVLEFIYHYGDKICALDVGLLDFKYRTKANHMKSYYLQDWYKVMKTYRWKLVEEHKSEYLSVMRNVGKAISIKYQIELLVRIKNTSISLYTINLLENSIISRLKQMNMRLTPNTTKEIYCKVNEYLKPYVKYFFPYLQSKFKKSYLVYLYRGKEGQIQLSDEELKERQKAGSNCPFFKINVDDYNRLIDLSIRLLIDPQIILDCFIQVSNEHKIPINKLIHSFGINDLYLIPKENNIILRDSKKEVGSYPITKKKHLQIRVLIEKN